MSKIRPVLLGISFLLLFASLFKDSTTTVVSASQKAEFSTIDLNDEEINNLAQQIVDNTIEVPDLEKTYASLSYSQRVQLLETVGIIRGIPLDTLRNNFDPGAERLTTFALSEIIEHLSTVCSNCAYYADTYWNDALCDSDSSDVDWVFRFGRPPGLTSNYRASDHLSPTVWAMLAWYQLQYGGINAHNITDTRVYICLGDNGVAYGGGAAHIKDHLFIYSP